VARLVDDHANAARLAEGLRAIEGLTVDTPQTNIFYIHMDPAACDGLRAAMAREQIRATVGPHTRLVTHLNVSADDVEKVIRVIAAYFSDWKAA
jgi:threonine aldolase